MTSFTRRLSIPELSERVLQMAKTGVYRESVFEALQPLATKQQIRKAIAHAKRFGLHSVASLRDAELGTYYQLDETKYQAWKHKLHAPDYFGEDADLMQQVTQATQSVQRLLRAAKVLAGILGLLGAIGAVTGHGQLSLALFSSAIGVMGVWGLQRWIARSILSSRTDA
jgi:hypothetical protein